MKDKKENLNEEKVMKKFFQNKHLVLIYIRERNNLGEPTTFLDIKKRFKMKGKYPYQLLEKLEREGDLIKGEKVMKNGKEYYNYLITEKAREELKVISLNINGDGRLSSEEEGTIDKLKELSIECVNKFIPKGDVSKEMITYLTNRFQDFFNNSND